MEFIFVDMYITMAIDEIHNYRKLITDFVIRTSYHINYTAYTNYPNFVHCRYIFMDIPV